MASITKSLQTFLPKHSLAPSANNLVGIDTVDPNSKFPAIISSISKHKTLKGSFIYRETNTLDTELTNVILNLYQGGAKTPKVSLVSKLIKMAWGNMFYYQLRTLKQLGYIVWSERIIKDNQVVCLL